MSLPKDKIKFSLWLSPETMKTVNDLYQGKDCKSRSEFIEKAIKLYVGYLTADDKSNLLPNIFLSNMRGIVSESDSRISRLLFKIAVEMSMMMNLLAFEYDIDPNALQRLRGSCVEEVKRTNGAISLEEAIRWQGK